MKLYGKTQSQVDIEKATQKTEIVLANRKRAYQEESDPLFFDWQRGEATETQWLAKITEIKARFPKEE